ncbi:ATP-binding protein [Bradyrhizobium sp.]|jgi:hypothetical protein|uniref:ATP-binding protein n=1 Tax=Bradyrhizobium sp. TaxID=376 RepID=UPI003C1546BF
MNDQAFASWRETNRRNLAGEIATLRETIEHCLQDKVVALRSEASQQHPATSPALDQLCNAFGLSTFERNILLMCAGVELDSRFAELLGGAGAPVPSFGFALSAFDGAHWSALSPDGPLRHWTLVELGNGPTLTGRRLTIDETVLHYLAGVPVFDPVLSRHARVMSAPENVAPSHRLIAEKIARLWADAPNSSPPAVALAGADDETRRTIAACAAAMLNLRLYTLAAADIPNAPAELENLCRRFEREEALGGGALLVECDDAERLDAPRTDLAGRIVDRIRGPLVLAQPGIHRATERQVIQFDAPSASASERAVLWRTALEKTLPALQSEAERLAGSFALGPAAVISAVACAVSASAEGSAPIEHLWDACRAQSRLRLGRLASRIEAVTDWDDLILPAKQKEILRHILIHVRRRQKVYGDWGFQAKGARGLGVSALFAGPSGTGKTMAAEVLANALRLDLFRIDLSQVVSKYIGETEKNLRSIFDAAEEGAAVLLFDEADALFGKRTDVKDSHDRYANIEVSYLLQRMEAYRGLAILTTNRKSALDQAFLRRLRFVVEFPFPQPAERADIWRRAFPKATPTENLSFHRLAQLHVAGGNIRNIAMGAAFLAADQDQHVGMSHLLCAARQEFLKIEKPLTDAETAGWV